MMWLYYQIKTWISSSVVDYVTVTPNLFDHIDQFQVNSKFRGVWSSTNIIFPENILAMVQDTDSEVPGLEPTKRYKCFHLN